MIGKKMPTSTYGQITSKTVMSTVSSKPRRPPVSAVTWRCLYYADTAAAKAPAIILNSYRVLNDFNGYKASIKISKGKPSKAIGDNPLKLKRCSVHLRKEIVRGYP